MLKRIYLLFGVTLISLSLCACGLTDSLDDAYIDTYSKDDAEIESFSRVVDYEINDTVMNILSLDNETIRLLDEMYIAVSEAYADLSAQQFYTTVYDAVVAFDGRFQDKILKLECSTEEERQFLLEVSDVTMNSLAVANAGYEHAVGNISIENAAFNILVAADSILSYMYQDYVPIYQPCEIDVDSIFKMYEENELAAEAELNNQLLCVSGTVYEVARDVMDKPYVGLSTYKGVSYELLRCYTNSNLSDKIVSLKKGDKVSCYIQIIDKDTFNINAKLWSISLINDDYSNPIEVNNELIDTEYYTLTIPSNWKDKFCYEIIEKENYNYTLSLYHKESKEDNFGGHLFSIHLLTEFEEYRNYPSYDILGSLEVYRIGSYNVVVTYPTDVQHSDSAIKEYQDMENDIKKILSTISYKTECSFSGIPLAVDNNAQ